MTLKNIKCFFGFHDTEAVVFRDYGNGWVTNDWICECGFKEDYQTTSSPTFKFYSEDHTKT